MQRLHFYEQIHKLSNAVNEAAGELIFIGAFADLPFFSFKVQMALDGDLATMAQVLTTLGPYSAFLFLSARARSLVRLNNLKVTLNSRLLEQEAYVFRRSTETSTNYLFQPLKSTAVYYVVTVKSLALREYLTL